MGDISYESAGGGTIAKPIWFDPHRRAATPELRAAIASLIVFLEQREAALVRRQHARKEVHRQAFHLAIECIACNLAGLSLMGPDLPLAVPRSSGVMWAKGRYRVPVYGQHFLAALDLMSHPEIRLIESLERGYRLASDDKQQSTIRPTPIFDARVRPALSGWESFSRTDDSEVLIMKGAKDRQTGKAEAIEYLDTANTRRMRKEIQRINATLRDAPLKLVSDDVYGAICITDDDGRPVDPTRRAVRRIFNNASWFDGGRLYDGFWETMRREDRFKFLRIRTNAHPDGERIANVDFGQLFPTLAYYRFHAKVPDGDLYDISGDGSSREGWKTLVNALLFAVGPMTRWPEETSDLFPPGTKLRDAVNQVRRVHAPIASLFGTGIGFRLMLTESGILIEALGHFSHLGITALPLHDSVLVAISDAEAATRIMAEAFGMFSQDARAKLKVDIG